jgi:hypothetical protein|tara:strand:- start:143 stop:250 length:108 start_codon:yes stop_codon:yes gene_type:complete
MDSYPLLAPAITDEQKGLEVLTEGQKLYLQFIKKR